MNETIEFLLRRRSIPAVDLVEPGPDDAQIETLLTIAARVPDHGKLTPWRFILFRGEARAEAGQALAALLRASRPDADDKQVAFETNRFTRSPLVVAVVSRAAPHVKICEWEQVLSAGAAAMNLVVAAQAMGFGAQWITEWVAYDEAARAILGLEPHERLAGLVHIGSPDIPPFERPRPALADIVTDWRR